MAEPDRTGQWPAPPPTGPDTGPYGPAGQAPGRADLVPTSRFAIIRVDPRMSDPEFARCCAEIRARIHPDMRDRVLIVPAEQVIGLG